MITVAISLFTATAMAHETKTKKGAGHDKEHHHVDTTADHDHEDTHHKPHDHKAHHPDHDPKMKTGQDAEHGTGDTAAPKKK